MPNPLALLLCLFLTGAMLASTATRSLFILASIVMAESTGEVFGLAAVLT
jgi:hypothetical protein